MKLSIVTDNDVCSGSLRSFSPTNFVDDQLDKQWRNAYDSYEIGSTHGSDIVWYLNAHSINIDQLKLLKSQNNKILVSVRSIADVENMIRVYDHELNSYVDRFHATAPSVANALLKHTHVPVFIHKLWIDQHAWCQGDKQTARKTLRLPTDARIISLGHIPDDIDVETRQLSSVFDIICFKRNTVVTATNLPAHVKEVLQKLPITIEQRPFTDTKLLFEACDIHVVLNPMDDMSPWYCRAMMVPVMLPHDSIVAHDFADATYQILDGDLSELKRVMKYVLHYGQDFEPAINYFIPRGMDPFKRMLERLSST